MTSPMTTWKASSCSGFGRMDNELREAEFRIASNQVSECGERGPWVQG